MMSDDTMAGAIPLRLEIYHHLFIQLYVCMKMDNNGNTIVVTLRAKLI